jgi:hypothetical protein
MKARFAKLKPDFPIDRSAQAKPLFFINGVTGLLIASRTAPASRRPI